MRLSLQTKSQQLKFSVLMAVYFKDNPCLFANALNSICLQTELPDEVVLVEDGPLTSELSALIDSFRTKLNIVSVKLSENKGLAVALNAGLKVVSNDIVYRADSDDVNRPDRFEKQLKFFLDDYDLVGGAIQEIDEAGVPIAVRSLPTDDVDIRKFLKFRNPFNHMSVAFRKDVVLACGGYPNIYLKEDYALWAKMLNYNARALNLKDVLVDATAGNGMYRRRGGWRYCLSEIELQKHLLRCGVKNLFEAVFTGVIRSSVFLVPAYLRGFIYERFLRNKPSY